MKAGFRSPANRRRLARWIFPIALVLALGLALCWFFPEQVLTVDSGEVKAEVMVVLGGGGTERTGRAAELFKAGAAPLIICTGYGDAKDNESCLTHAGVPVGAILLEPKSHTTRENAQYTIALLRERHLKSAIIVTTWYHSRRALATFEHYAPDLKFYSRPAYLGFDARNRKVVRGHMRMEYSKILGYWLRYGVWPL